MVTSWRWKLPLCDIRRMWFEDIRAHPLSPPSAAWHFCFWPCSLSVTAVQNMKIHFSCNRLSESGIQRCASTVLWDLQEKSRNGEPRYVCHATSVFFFSTVAFFSLTVRVVKCSHLCDSFAFAWPDPKLWLSPWGKKGRLGELLQTSGVCRQSWVLWLERFCSEKPTCLTQLLFYFKTKSIKSKALKRLCNMLFMKY